MSGADTVVVTPCPFCGSTNTQVAMLGYQRRGYCKKCGAQGPGFHGGQDRKSSSDLAIAAWNTRATQADALAVMREAEGAMRNIFAHFDPKTTGGGAPDHCHTRLGIWDDGNTPDKAGKPCEWCQQWNEARTTLANLRAAIARAGGA